MKLLYITNGITGAGGLERVLAIKTSGLIECYNYEIHIVTLNESRKEPFYEFNSQLKMHSVEAVGGAIKYAFKYIFGLRKIVKELSPDIIIVCDDGLKGFLLPFLLQKPCPMVYERHVSKDIFVTENKSILKKIFIQIKFDLMDYLGKKFDKFVILSKCTLKEWNLKNIEIIPNPSSFSPLETAVLDNKTVIAVGKQSYQKGYDRLLRAWCQVIKVYPDWQLKIYGKIDEKHGLEKLTNDLQLGNNVKFYRPVKNIHDKYLQSSVFCMSSRFEGFPMVLLEAMAYGVPCVSFDCPCGPSDIIRNGEDGILIPEGDINGLANGLIKLIANPTLRKQMGLKSKENVQRYNRDEIIKIWDNLFSLLKQN